MRADSMQVMEQRLVGFQSRRQFTAKNHQNGSVADKFNRLPANKLLSDFRFQLSLARKLEAVEEELASLLGANSQFRDSVTPQRLLYRARCCTKP